MTDHRHTDTDAPSDPTIDSIEEARDALVRLEHALEPAMTDEELATLVAVEDYLDGFVEPDEDIEVS